jgi:hypothetical protein
MPAAGTLTIEAGGAAWGPCTHFKPPAGDEARQARDTNDAAAVGIEKRRLTAVRHRYKS